MDHPGPGKSAPAVHGWTGAGGGGILETKDHNHPVENLIFILQNFSRYPIFICEK